MPLCGSIFQAETCQILSLAFPEVPLLIWEVATAYLVGGATAFLGGATLYLVGG